MKNYIVEIGVYINGSISHIEELNITCENKQVARQIANEYANSNSNLRKVIHNEIWKNVEEIY